VCPPREAVNAISPGSISPRSPIFRRTALRPSSPRQAKGEAPPTEFISAKRTVRLPSVLATVMPWPCRQTAIGSCHRRLDLRRRSFFSRQVRENQGHCRPMEWIISAPFGFRMAKGLSSPEANLGTVLGFSCRTFPGGKPRPISPEGMSSAFFATSPDGKYVAAEGPDHKGYLYPTEAGEPRPLPGYIDGEWFVAWSPDGRSLFVYNYRQLPAQVQRLDISTGKRTPWKQVVPSDAAGIDHLAPILISRDGKSCIYGYGRFLSDIYLVNGLN
jgi:hypothetical protein